MIAFDLTQEAVPATKGLVVEPTGDDSSEGTLSFSALLKGVKDNSEAAEKSTLLLALDENSMESDSGKEVKSQTTLLSLLGVEDENIDNLDSLLSGDSLELNSELKDKLSSEDLKLLAKDAKNYLKEQIMSSDGFKRSEVDTLPKTLNGLVKAADKFGIDLSKITLEEVMQKGTGTFEENSRAQNLQKSSALEEKEESEAQKSSNSIALFQKKGQKSITTEQIVNVKNFQKDKDKEGVKSKNQSDDTLKLLLQGESSMKKESTGLTSDFSVATAKVIAPSVNTQTPTRGENSLESLLNPEAITKEDDTPTKSEVTSLPKADSFEVKLNEAKQMVKYLSQDVKQAIDNYKAPFTRVKVQLNPAQLGEIELTVVQRGKDLHVNLSSNNSAINTLAMNASDLKQQLQNSGINNASLNFSNNSQSGESGYSGQQQQQQQERAHDEYNYFENEEQNEEIISSLEIVVPNYA